MTAARRPDLASLVAIDVHTHVHRSVSSPAGAQAGESLTAMASYFGTSATGYTVDLSGWSPKYFPPILVQYANTLLRKKVLFGTEFPMLTPERWRGDLDKAAIRDEVKPDLYKNNAARLLGLGTGPAGP